MKQRVFWSLSVALFAAAAVVFFVYPGPLGQAFLDYRFWALLVLATLSAVIGNLTLPPRLPKHQDGLHHSS
jgi:hypothetical protein